MLPLLVRHYEQVPPYFGLLKVDVVYERPVLLSLHRLTIKKKKNKLPSPIHRPPHSPHPTPPLPRKKWSNNSSRKFRRTVKLLSILNGDGFYQFWVAPVKIWWYNINVKTHAVKYLARFQTRQTSFPEVALIVDDVVI